LLNNQFFSFDQPSTRQTPTDHLSSKAYAPTGQELGSRPSRKRPTNAGAWTSKVGGLRTQDARPWHRPAAAWIMSWSSANGIWDGSWLCIRYITTRRARTWGWARTHRCDDPSNGVAGDASWARGFQAPCRLSPAVPTPWVPPPSSLTRSVARMHFTRPTRRSTSGRSATRMRRVGKAAEDAPGNETGQMYQFNSPGACQLPALAAL